MPIQITARRDGFRRCGMAHSAKTQTYPDGHFTPAQLLELESEPQLIVVRLDDSQPVVASDPAFKDVLANHQSLQKDCLALQVELSRRASIIDALSDKLAIEFEFGDYQEWQGELNSMVSSIAAQKLAALNSPPDDPTEKREAVTAETEKVSGSTNKTKK